MNILDHDTKDAIYTLIDYIGSDADDYNALDDSSREYLAGIRAAMATLNAAAGAPLPTLAEHLEHVETLLSESIMDEQDKAEQESGESVVYPENAAFELDTARDCVREAIDTITALTAYAR